MKNNKKNVPKNRIKVFYLKVEKLRDRLKEYEEDEPKSRNPEEHGDLS